MWSDPIKSRLAQETEEIDNEDRLISVKFGWPILKNLLENSKLKTLIRAHQQKDHGYKLHMWAGEEEDPPCITIFSAPNYCDHMNPGSILITGTASAKASILMYEESKTKPYYLPDLEIGGYPDDPFDAISWF